MGKERSSGDEACQAYPQSIALMTEKRIRHLLVIDGDNPVGVVSIGEGVKSVVTEQEMVISLQHTRSTSSKTTSP